MTRQEIENRVAELDAMIAEDNKISEENSRLYHESQNKLQSDLTAHLKDAGYPVDEYTKIDIRIYGKPEPEQNRVCVYFGNKNRNDVSVTFRNKAVEEISITGISGHGTAENLSDMRDYYKKVALVLENINSKYFSTNMSLFFDTLESFTYPEMRMGKLHPNVREERNELNRELKLLDIGLEVGKSVEVYIEKQNRWSRSQWVEATVEKMTEKLIYVDCKNYGTKAIKRSDVLQKIRAVQAAEIQKGEI